jgi:hypothetical protein
MSTHLLTRIVRKHLVIIMPPKSQHIWVRRFRDSLERGEPKLLYYPGACQIYEVEDNLPGKIQEQIKDWVTGKSATPEELEGLGKKERRKIFAAFREAVAELGYTASNHGPAPLPAAKVVMSCTPREAM